MGKLTSNYNFVPLNEIVYYPEWANQVSQDIPFSDGEDGIITVTLHNVSPLFTRNGSANRDKKEAEVFSAHVMDGEKRRYFLPATSIKGMLRTTMEIMAFGKMTQYNDRYFSMRDIGGNKTTDSNNYIDLMKGVKPAWLRQEGDKLYLTPCDGNIDYIDDYVLAKKYPSFAQVYSSQGIISGWKKNKAIEKDAGTMYPIIERNGKKYNIVCTGNFNNKSRDYLFPIGKSYEIPVTEKIQIEFQSVHNQAKDFEDINKHLKTGQRLAVFYLPGNESNNEIQAIGLSKMLRYPYQKGVKELVCNQQPNKKGEHDLVEIIFGYITERGEDSLRGRVQIGNAFAERSLADDELEKEVAGVLGQPKASFYPFYLKQTSNPYKTYKNADGIAGRKLYRVHQGSTVTALPPGNNNENTTSSFRPIPVGLTFQLKIVVHNLRKVETGALLSAINLHGNNDKAWHNIGMARGYGYGKLKIDNISLSQGFSSSIEDYMKAFEKEMSNFTFKNMPSKLLWGNTKQINSLMSILGEHNNDDLKVMSLNQYKEAKENAHFDLLDNSEKSISIRSYLTSEDKEEIRKAPWINSHTVEYDKVESLRREHKYKEAIAKLENITKELKKEGLSFTHELLIIEDVKKDYEAYLQELTDNKKDPWIEILEKGLEALLDETYPAGANNAGLYKVNSYNILNGKSDTWVKKKKKILPQEVEKNNTEKEAYASTFRRLYPKGNHPKKEDKDLAKKDSGIWRKAKAFLEDRFEELLGDLYNA